MNIKRPYFFAGFILVISFVTFSFYFLATPILCHTNGVRYVLKPGTTIKSLSKDLNLTRPVLFEIFARLRGATRDLQTGEYFFENGIKPWALLDKIVDGKVVYHAFTIVPGTTFLQIKTALKSQHDLVHKLTPKSIKALSLKGSPEGLFLPETYYYRLDASDMDVLARAYDKMQQVLGLAWEDRAKALPYKMPYEALIAASLIEKETHLQKERPLVASVLVNRLRKHMRLQFDPTVIYGLGDAFKGRLHADDLKKKTPYNSYLHKGLPPTPIAMPSVASIQAALHPAVTGYYYFVAVGDGSHVFSETLGVHNKAVAKYQKDKRT